MKNSSFIIQKILYIISFVAGLVAVLGLIESEFRSSQLPYLHYYYGIVSRHYMRMYIIPEKIWGISVFVGLIGLVAVFKKGSKNTFRWLGITGAVLISIVWGYGFCITPFQPGIMTRFDQLSKGEYNRSEVSNNIVSCREEIDVKKRDEYIQEILADVPYQPENYKNYNLYGLYPSEIKALKIPSLSFNEQRIVITEIDEWWRINKNYLIWNDKPHKFIMDEGARAAYIWTDEYRKTHPWPKEKEPDKPK